MGHSQQVTVRKIAQMQNTELGREEGQATSCFFYTQLHHIMNPPPPRDRHWVPCLGRRKLMVFTAALLCGPTTNYL